MTKTANRVRFATFSQEAHHYTRDDDLTFISFEREEGGTHNYIEPMYGMETDIIEMTIEDGRLIGYVEAPAGSEVVRTDRGELMLFLPNGTFGVYAADAVFMGRAKECGLRWIRAREG